MNVKYKIKYFNFHNLQPGFELNICNFKRFKNEIYIDGIILFTFPTYYNRGRNSLFIKEQYKTGQNRNCFW